MKSIIKAAVIMFVSSIFITACKKDSTTTPTTVYYQQQDQMGRPAINTVFNPAATDKETFNMTTPSSMGAAFQSKFESRLLALNAGYTTNALGQDAAAFTGLLATDVLNVSTNGTTTFFDGNPANTLSGRKLADDVINVELLLIFGGPAGTSNPGLTDDHVNGNDKAFLSTFPYLASPF
jgi:hypothetical protein